MVRAALLIVALALGGKVAAQGHDGHAAPAKPDYARMWQERLAKAPQHGVAVAFDDAGVLWLARAAGRHVVVSHSADHGHSFSAPVRVNAEPEYVEGNGEGRPKIAVAGGRVLVSWTQSLAQPFSGHVRFAYSADGGRSFSAPRTINNDTAATAHRFDALLADATGRVTLVWLDKRDGAADPRYAGAAVYVAESRDGGASFDPDRKLADHSCECCRIGLAADVDGTPVALWRHVFDGGIRDFALARIDGPLRRASKDGWRIDACPHHGGALAIDAEGGRHLAWFTGAERNPGLFYRRVDGERMTPPLAFGNLDAQAGHPAVLVDGNRVWLAWQEFDGQALGIRVQSSADRGASWSAPTTLDTTAGAADYPQLVRGAGRNWLAWNTVDAGLRLIALEAAP
jgi:hypothetical protein